MPSGIADDAFMYTIEAGVEIEVRDVHGRWLPRRALTGVVEGRDFQVVWACREEDWEAASKDAGREPQRTPWPAEDVRLALREHAHA